MAKGLYLFLILRESNPGVETEAPQHNLRAFIRHDGTVKFSLDERHLITDVGLIELPTSNSSSTQHINWGLHNNQEGRNWILWKDHPILWLPSKYRPECQAFHNNALALGLESGQVVIIKFKKNDSPIS